MDKVSVVVPVRNEEPYLRKSLLSLLNQRYPSSDYEVIVVDGRSSDRSREIVKDLGLEFSNLLLLDNPSGIAPTAMNIGIRRSCGSVIVRADAHNEYPSDYIANCVLYLQQTKGGQCGWPLDHCSAC